MEGSLGLRRKLVWLLVCFLTLGETSPLWAATQPVFRGPGRVESTAIGITIPDYTNAAMPSAQDQGTLREQNNDAANAPRGIYEDTGYGNLDLSGNAVLVNRFCDDATAFSNNTCLDDAVADLGSTNKHT